MWTIGSVLVTFKMQQSAGRSNRNIFGSCNPCSNTRFLGTSIQLHVSESMVFIPCREDDFGPRVWIHSLSSERKRDIILLKHRCVNLYSRRIGCGLVLSVGCGSMDIVHCDSVRVWRRRGSMPRRDSRGTLQWKPRSEAYEARFVLIAEGLPNLLRRDEEGNRLNDGRIRFFAPNGVGQVQ